MTAYILDGKKLSGRISAAFKSQAKLNVEYHLIACSALNLAITSGRPDHLNEIFAGLPRLYQDAFKAWCAPNATHWFGKNVEDDNKWLTFESQGKDGKPARGFRVMPKKVRPELGTLDGIANDLSKAFFMKSADGVAKTNDAFNVEQYIATFAKMAEKMATLVSEGKLEMPTFVMIEAQKLAASVANNAKAKPILATVDGVAVTTARDVAAAPTPVMTAAEAEAPRKARKSGDAGAPAKVA